MKARIVSYCIMDTDAEILVGTYRSMGINYPKFFKMDRLSKVGFLAAEKVLSAAGMRNDDPKPDMAVVLANGTSSTVDDVEFQKGLDPENFFPSPSLFVYTLSNIVCGEIAIRNKILGETSFYVMPSPSAEFMLESVRWAFGDGGVKHVLCGWVECLVPGSKCVMMLVSSEASDGPLFCEEEICRICQLSL